MVSLVSTCAFIVSSSRFKSFIECYRVDDLIEIVIFRFNDRYYSGIQIPRQYFFSTTIVFNSDHGERFSLCEKCIDPYNFSLSPNQRSKMTAAADRTDKWLYEVIPFTGKSR